MIAFHDIKAEMRESCLSLTRPLAADAPTEAASICRETQPCADDLDEHIEPWMAAAFEGLIHAGETDDPFALVPCFMNGKRAAVIALARQIGRKTHVMPLFLACQPWMRFSGQPDGEEGGGGPARDADTAERPAPR